MKIEIKDRNFCPRFSYCIIRDVEIKDSIKKIQDRLRSSGIKVYNNIIDATNYIMLDIGQPMHAYDLDKLKKLEVKKGIFFGIKGPKEIGISKNTKNVLLESANFNAQDIRETSKKLDIKTEASYRFERGVDINLCKEAIEMAIKMINGKPDKIIDIYYKKFRPKKIKFKTNIKEKNILKSLGFKIKGEIIEVPSWRHDISIPEDLEEEIYRIDGYDKIKSEMPALSLRVPESNSWARLAKQSLSSSGYTEVYNYSFANKGELKIKNKNKYLRINLLDAIKENLKNNLKNFKEVRIFELGKIYTKRKEIWILAGAGADFLEVKGVLEKLLEDMGIGLENFDNNWIKDNLFELDFDKLSKLASGEREYQPIPKYPAVKRDISILVNYDVVIEEVLRIIQNAGGNLVFDVDLFDVYEPEDQNQKSLAFHIIYQAVDKTLTDKEINKLHKKIEQAIEKEINGTIR